MSASEKLKALEAGAPPKSGVSLELPGVNPEFSSPGTQKWLNAIRPALPQIVAVVEAAEKSGCNSPKTNLGKALAALEEALT